MSQFVIPIDKTQFDLQITKNRQSFKQSLPKKFQHLIDYLPENEGQIFRRMNSSCPVLWVAPHGFFGDAVHTDYIGIIAAQMMAGSCLVNNKFCRCPLPEPGYGEIANLNNPEDPNPHSKAFVNKLKSAISIIRLKSEQPPIIVILLNQSDISAGSMNITVASRNENIDSDTTKWVMALKQAVTSNDFNINLIENQIDSYDRTLFTSLHYNQSESGPIRLLKIELNCEYVTYENIISISGFISRALSYVCQANDNLKQLCIKNQSVENIIETEEEPDMKLVEEAGLKLTDIISRHYENAMIEAGNYIVQTFYSNDIERARNKQATKEKSLHQLILYLQNQKNNAPSKSWLYNAVNLAVDSSDYKNNHMYAKLMLSHKIELLPIRHKGLKKYLIKEIGEKKLTISQLKDHISQVKDLPYDKMFPEPKADNPQKPVKKTMPRLLKKSEKKGENQSKKILNMINDPKKFLKSDIISLFSHESLADMTVGKRRQILRKLEKKHSEVLSIIQQLKSKILIHEDYLKQYQYLMVELEKSIQTN
jgi:hypothetical protein